MQEIRKGLSLRAERSNFHEAEQTAGDCRVAALLAMTGAGEVTGRMYVAASTSLRLRVED